MVAALVGLNARFTHTNLALLYLRNEISTAGHTAALLEFDTATRRQDIIEAIVFVRPDAILLSVYVWNSVLVGQLLPDLRALLPDSVLILGGPEVSYNAAEWLEAHPEVDYVVTGPGEEAIRLLAVAGFPRPGSTSASATADAAVLSSRILSVPNRPFAAIPFPYSDDDMSRLSHRYVYYESSRGCPCHCAYCVSGRDDQRVQVKDVDATVDELQRFIDFEPRWAAPPIVKFVDRTFNASPRRAREIWRFLLDAPTGATYHFEIHPAFLTDPDFDLLTTAPPGRFQFEVGVQSVHDSTLHAVGRSAAAAAEWQRIGPAIARLIAIESIEIHLDLIVGLPGENVAAIGASIDKVLALKPDRFDIGFLKSLPGTAIAATAAENQQISMRVAPYQVLANRWLSVSDFALLRRVEQLVDSIWNANHLGNEIDAVAARYGGYFNGLCALSAHADRTGYNLSTRRPHKVAAFVEAALSEPTP
ncbi:MAG: DUF4080 domain-containing protein [Spirochaetaceae bacterium]|nr:MAG: DUF4080 domain-containing protein [Spirochaetaceae bacterium]